MNSPLTPGSISTPKIFKHRRRHSFGAEKILRMLCVLNGIETKITNHFEVLIRDVDNQSFDKIENRERFSNESIGTVRGIGKGNRFTIIMTDS